MSPKNTADKNSEQKTIEFQCRNCGHRFERTFRSDQIVGPHSQVKKGMGLAHRDPDDTVYRSRGYGTMPTVDCPTCGLIKHHVLG